VLSEFILTITAKVRILLNTLTHTLVKKELKVLFYSLLKSASNASKYYKLFIAFLNNN